MDQRNTSQLVRYIQTGLTIGLFTPEDIMKWADDVILKSKNPSRLFVEISLSDNKSIQHLIDAITEFITPNEPLVEAKYFFLLLHIKYSSGLLPLEKIRSILYRLIFKTQMSKDEERSIRKIDSIFEPFNRSYGSSDRQKAVEDFLTPYKDIENPYPMF
jgi:hypothetical protein